MLNFIQLKKVFFDGFQEGGGEECHRACDRYHSACSEDQGQERSQQFQVSGPW